MMIRPMKKSSHDARRSLLAAGLAALALCAATLLTSINGIFAAFSMVAHHAPDIAKRDPGSSLAEVVLQGFGESMAPGILGFTILSLIALILALGVYRQNPS